MEGCGVPGRRRYEREGRSRRKVSSRVGEGGGGEGRGIEREYQGVKRENGEGGKGKREEKVEEGEEGEREGGCWEGNRED